MHSTPALPVKQLIDFQILSGLLQPVNRFNLPCTNHIRAAAIGDSFGRSGQANDPAKSEYALPLASSFSSVFCLRYRTTLHRWQQARTVVAAVDIIPQENVSLVRGMASTPMVLASRFSFTY